MEILLEIYYKQWHEWNLLLKFQNLRNYSIDLMHK